MKKKYTKGDLVKVTKVSSPWTHVGQELMLMEYDEVDNEWEATNGRLPLYIGKAGVNFVHAGESPSRMRWPRGKYNGKRVVGVKILFRINLLRWQCRFRGYGNDPILAIGPFIWNFETNYHFRD